MSRLLIIDGHAYAYRAYYAIRQLRSPSGRPTNAIYGFVKMLHKLRQGLQPSHLIVVWDGGLNDRRKVLLPDYKTNRPEMPVDLGTQLGDIAKYLDAEGVAQYCGEGVEADDYIACLARHGEKVGWNVVIASSDKDFMQLVSERVGLINPAEKKLEVWTKAQVVAKSGVEPGQIVDWLALMGDAVDNIPGVPGVGAQTAAKLLGQFGSFNEIVRRVAEVRGDKLRQSIQEAFERVCRNQELVRLMDVACEWDPVKMAVKTPDKEKLKELFRCWGFKDMSVALSQSEMIHKQAELI